MKDMEWSDIESIRDLTDELRAAIDQINKTYSGAYIQERTHRIAGDIGKDENWSSTGKSRAAHDAIMRAGDLSDTRSAGRSMENIQRTLNALGLELKRTVKETAGLIQDVYQLIPKGQSNFYSESGAGGKAHIKPLEWVVPIDKNGRILYDSLERGNLFYPTADESGTVKMLSAIEVGLRRVEQQLGYTKNQNIIRAGTKAGASVSDVREMAKRLDFVLNKQMRSAISPGSAMSQYNPSIISELQKTLKLEGTDKRTDVIESAAYLDHMFDAILEKHVHGSSINETDDQRNRYLQQISKMSLLIRSKGLEKGMREIRASGAFDDILGSPMGAPILTAIRNFAEMSTAMGPVSDSNGLRMTYMRGLDRALQFFLPPSSRKGYQTELGRQDFVKATRDFAHTKGAVIATRTQGGKDALDSKVYDTTRLVAVTQEQLRKALNKQRSDPSRTISAADAAKNALLSVEGDAMVLDIDAARERLGVETITKKISNNVIQKFYKDAVAKWKTNNKGRPNLQTRRALAEQAVAQAMSSLHGDVFDGREDLLTLGTQTGGGQHSDLADFIAEHVVGHSGLKLDTDKATTFGIRKQGKLNVGDSKRLALSKWVTPGAEIRATAQYTNMDALLPYLAQVFDEESGGQYGLDYWNKRLAGVKGLIETKKYAAKNVITPTTGLINDVFGTYAKNYKGTDEVHKSFAEAVKRYLPKEAEAIFDSVFNYNAASGRFVESSSPEQLAQFKRYTPLILQAMGMMESGGTEGLLEFYNDKGEQVKLSQEQLYQALSQGNGGALSYAVVRNHPFSLSLLQHASAHYGAPGSKNGYPVSYGYREFGAIDSQLGLAKIAGHNVSAVQEYYDALRQKTQLGQAQYQNLIDYQKSANRKTWGYHNGGQHTLEQLQTDGVLALDIMQLIDEDKLRDLNKDIRDNNDTGAGTGLFDVEQLAQHTFVGAIQAKQRAKYDEMLKSKEAAEREKAARLVEQAGGEEAVAKLVKTWSDAGLTQIDGMGLEAAAARQLGASMIPYAVYGSFADGTPVLLSHMGAGGTETGVSQFMFGSHLGANEQVNVLGRRVTDLGPFATGLESFLTGFRNYVAGNTFEGAPGEASSALGQQFYRLQLEAMDHLLSHGGSYFDKAHTVDIAHSAMPLNMSTGSVGTEYEQYLNNAIVLSPDDIGEMLNRVAGEQNVSVQDWNKWLAVQYLDVLGATGTKTVDSVLDEVKKGLGDKVEGDLDAKITGALKQKIIDSITLGSESFSENGLVALLNRYPSLAGRNDLRGVRLFANAAWKGKTGIIGGDQDLMASLNADFDGDHLVLSLPGADQSVEMSLERRQQVLSQVREGLVADQDTERAISRYLSKRAEQDKKAADAAKGVLPGPTGSTIESDAFVTNPNQEGSDIFLTKTGKTKVGPFSYIRQGFEDLFSSAGVFSSADAGVDTYTARIAAEALTGLLAIPEQKTISAKKMADGTDSGEYELHWSDGADRIYNMLRNRKTYTSASNFQQALDAMRDEGWLAKEGEGLGVFSDDMAQRRLGLSTVAAVASMAQKAVGNEREKTNLQAALDQLFGKGVISVDQLGQIKFSGKGGQTEIDESATSVEALEALGKIKFNDEFFSNAVTWLNSYAGRGAFDTVLAGADGGVRKIKSLGDIVSMRHAIIPGLQHNDNGIVYSKGKQKFTQQQIDALTKNGIQVTEDQTGFIFNENARQFLENLSSLNEISDLRLLSIAKQENVGKEFLDLTKQAAWLNANPQEKDPIHPGGYGTSATRLSKILYPFDRGDKLTTDYLKFVEQLTASGESAVDRTSRAALSDMFRSFQSIEGGNLAHIIAQTYLKAAKRGYYTIGKDTQENISALGVDNFIAAMTPEQATDLGFTTRKRSAVEPEGEIGLVAALEEYQHMADVLGKPINDPGKVPMHYLKSAGSALKQAFTRFLGAEGDTQAQQRQIGESEAVLYAALNNRPIYARADMLGWRVGQKIIPGLGQNLPEAKTRAVELGIAPDGVDWNNVNANTLIKWAQDKQAELREIENPDQATTKRIADLDQFIEDVPTRAVSADRLETVIGDFKTTMSNKVGQPSIPNVVQGMVLETAAKAYQQVIRGSESAPSPYAQKYYDLLEGYVNNGVFDAEAARTALLDPTSELSQAVESAVSSLMEQQPGAIKSLINAHPDNPEVVADVLRKLVIGSHGTYGGTRMAFFKTSTTNPDEGVATALLNAFEHNPYAQSIMGKMALSLTGESREELDKAEETILKSLVATEDPNGRVKSADAADPHYQEFMRGLAARTRYYKKIRGLEAQMDQARADGNSAELADLEVRYKEMRKNDNLYLDTDAVKQLTEAESEARAAGKNDEADQIHSRIDEITKDAEFARNASLASNWTEMAQENRIFLGQEYGVDLQKYASGEVAAGLFDQIVDMEAVQANFATKANLNKWKQAQKDLGRLIKGRNGLLRQQRILEASGKEGTDEYKDLQMQLEELGIEDGKEGVGTLIGGLRKYISGLESYFQDFDRENGLIKEDADGNIVYAPNSMLARAKFQYQFQQKKETEEEQLEEYRTLQQQRVSALAERGIAVAKLNDPNAHLSSDEREALTSRIEELNKLIDIHIKTRIEEIEELFKKTDSVSPDAKKEMEKVAARAAASEATNARHQEGLLKIANLQGQLDTEQGAFKTYSDLNNAEYRLWENEQKLGKASAGSPTARLLEMERHDLEVMRDIAKERVAMMEADTEAEQDAKHRDYLRGVNISAKERADIMLQQRQESYLNGQPRNPGLLGSIEGKVGGMLKYMVSGYGIFRIFNRLMQSIKQLTAEAKELDKVIVNLRIVTGDTKADTRNLMNEYSELAAQLGSTTKEVAASAIGWLRQGYSTAEAMDLVKSSMYLSTLGMMDSAAATKSLTSALKGFKLQASESMDVVDRLTALDLKAATSAGDIAEGLAQFANLGSLAGINIDQAAAYVATIADVTQMSGSSAGQALKTIISRYGNVKAGAYNQLNLSADVTDDEKAVNDVEKVLKNLGITIRSSNLQFRDFDDVLAEIAEKWDNLDTVSQKAIATSFAGIRQQEAFVTLMQNWDKYQELLSAAQNSGGTAERKYTSYREGVEAASKELVATIEESVNTAEVSELIRSVTQVLIKIAEWLPKLIKYLPNLFFSMQSIRALSGNSLLQQAWRGIAGSKFGQGFSSVWNANDGANHTFQGFWRGVGRGSKQGVWGDADPQFAKELGLDKQGLGRSANGQSRGVLDRLFKKRQGTTTTQSPTANTTADVAEAKDLAAATQPSGQSITTEFETWLSLAKQITIEFEKMAQSARGGANAEAEEAAHSEAGAAAEAAEATSSAAGLAAEEGEAVASATGMAAEQGEAAASAAGLAAEQGEAAVGGASAAPSGVGGGAVLAGVSVFINQLMSAYSAYKMAGDSHTNKSGKGGTVQSSEAAKQEGKATVLLWSAIPFIGQAIGEHMADEVMAKIDQKRDEADWKTEQANQILGVLTSISTDITTIAESVDSISSEDAQAREAAVIALRDALFSADNHDTLLALTANLSSDSDIYDLTQKMTSSSVSARREAVREFQIAESQAKTKAARDAYASEDYKQQHEIVGSQWIEYNKTREGYNSEYGITNEDYAEAERIGVTKGTIAAIGGSIAAVGGLMGAATAATGIGALIGAAIAAIGGAATVIGGFEIAEETKAQALIAQQEEEQRWMSLSAHEQRLELEEVRDEIYKSIESEDDNTAELEKLQKRLMEVNDMIDGLKDYEAYLQKKMEETNRNRMATALLESKTEQGNYLTDLTINQAKRIGISQLYERLANQVVADGGLYGIPVRGKDGKITERFKEYAKSALQSDAELKAAMSGANYTVAGALTKLNTNDWADREILENFANVFGVTIDTLVQHAKYYTEQFGTLTYSELIKDTGDLLEEQQNYHSLLGEITDSTKSATEWMNQISTKFPDLLSYMSDTPTLIGKIMDKLRDLTEFEFRTQWNSIAGSDAAFESDNPNEQTLRKDITGYLDGKYGPDTAKHIDEVIDASNATNLNGLIQYMYGLDSNSDDFKKLHEAVGNVGGQYELTSDAYKESLSNYIDYNAKLLDNQINNLTKQRDALGEIVKQREYENRLIEAKLKLEDAMEEKQRVYRAGVGFVYEADQGAIAEAQQKLDEVKIEKDVSAITAQIELLTGEKEEWSNIWEQRNFELQEQEATAFGDRFLGLNSTVTTETGKVTSAMLSYFGEKGSVSNALAAAKDATDGFHESFTTFTENYLQEQQIKKENVVANVKAAWENFNKVSQTHARGSAEYNEALKKYQNTFSAAENAGYITSKSDGDDTNNDQGPDTVHRPVRTRPDWTSRGDAYGSKKSYDAAHEDIIDNDSEVLAVDNPYAGHKLLVHAGKGMPDSAFVYYMKMPYRATTMPENVADQLFNSEKAYRLTDLTDSNKRLGSIGPDELRMWGGDPHNIPDGIYINTASNEFFLMQGGNYYPLGKVGGQYVKYDYEPEDGMPLYDWQVLKVQKPGEYVILDEDPVKREEYAEGILDISHASSQVLINELGTEAIITPSGTVTALPSHSGIVPADITKNLWALGEIAPSVLRAMNSISLGAYTTFAGNAAGVDESVNISNLTMSVNADSSFDADAFVESIRQRVALTRNLRK